MTNLLKWNFDRYYPDLDYSITTAVPEMLTISIITKAIISDAPFIDYI